MSSIPSVSILRGGYEHHRGRLSRNPSPRDWCYCSSFLVMDSTRRYPRSLSEAFKEERVFSMYDSRNHPVSIVHLTRRQRWVFFLLRLWRR
jgi:hypothetical protein